MDLYKQFHDEAKGIKPLADRVRTLEQQYVSVRERIRDTVEDVDRKAEGLAAHRDRAGESLTKSTSAFSEWQGRLRRLEREHGTACEALALLERDIGPKIVRDLADARQKRDTALDRVYNAAKPACEAKMDALLADVVDERDAFVEAWQKVYHDFGTHLGHLLGGSRQAPVAQSVRLHRMYHRNTGTWQLRFTNKPPPPAPKPKPKPKAAARAPDSTADAPNAPRTPPEAPGVAEAVQDAPEAPQRVLTGSGRQGDAP